MPTTSPWYRGDKVFRGGADNLPIKITPDPGTLPAGSYVMNCQVTVDFAGNVYVTYFIHLPGFNVPILVPPVDEIQVRGANAPGNGAPVFGDPQRVTAVRRQPQGVKCRGDLVPRAVIIDGASSLAADPNTGRLYLTWSEWNTQDFPNAPDDRYDVAFIASAVPPSKELGRERRRPGR